MILHYLMYALRFIVALFSRPNPAFISKIDVNARCPICGHRSGRLEAQRAHDGQRAGVFCLHECMICHARWFEKPVVEAPDGAVYAAPTSPKSLIDPEWQSHQVNSRGQLLSQVKQ